MIQYTRKLWPTCQIQMLSVLSVILWGNPIATSTFAQPEMSVVSGAAAKTRVLIVGAGVAGLGAATRLLENGVTDVTILEAMDRVGGRVVYKHLGKYGGVDLGAHWVHGQQGNAVYDIAEPLGLVQHSGDFTNPLFLRPDGSHLDLEGKFRQLYNKAVGELETLDDTEKHKPLLNITYERVAEFGAEQNLSRQDVDALHRFMVRSICIMEACADLNDLSVSSQTEYDEAPGDRLIEWKNGGMHSIVRLLMGTHEVKTRWTNLGVGEKVKLSSRVSRVHWNHGDGVSVTTESGETHTADFLIFTSSLNVLKKKHESMFHPALPKDKVAAIQGLGMDVVDKIYLIFEEPWLPKDVSGITPLHSKAYPSETKDWGEDIVSFSKENHNPHALAVWLVGEAAKRMEEDSEQQVSETCMRVLRKHAATLYPNIPDPVRIVRSRWWNTEDVAGSYSFNHRDSEGLEKPRELLGQPLIDRMGKPVVMFAGEATNPIHYSTVNGALESGWREADRLLQFLTTHNRT